MILLPTLLQVFCTNRVILTSSVVLLRKQDYLGGFLEMPQRAGFMLNIPYYQGQLTQDSEESEEAQKVELKRLSG